MAKGSCLCSGVEITTSIEPKATVACSCTSCQSCSASAFTINLVYPKDTVEVTKGKEHLKVFKGEFFCIYPRRFPATVANNDIRKIQKRRILETMSSATSVILAAMPSTLRR